jgi:hypothetical protein
MPSAERNLDIHVSKAVPIYAFFRRGGDGAIIAHTRTAIVTCNDGTCSRIKKGHLVCWSTDVHSLFIPTSLGTI